MLLVTLSRSLRWHAWLGSIVGHRNLFSRFTCLRSIPHAGELKGGLGGA